MILTQVICFVIIVALGLFVFKRYPLRLQTKHMVSVSLLLVLSLVLSYFSLMLGLFGFPSLKIGFAQLPLMLLGVLFGPAYGFIGGLLYDLLGLIVTPTSMPFLGFTLNNVLVCTLPGLWMQIGRKCKTKTIERGILAAAAIFLAVCVTYIWTYTYTEEFQTKIMAMNNLTRLYVSLGAAVFVALILASLHQVLARFADQKETIINWMVCVIVVEIGLNLCLTPLWLHIMYGTPYVLNFFVRVFKIMIMIPLQTVIGYMVWKALMQMGQRMSMPRETMAAVETEREMTGDAGSDSSGSNDHTA